MVIFLGVFQIAMAYAFFASGLKLIIAVEASIISMIEPAFNPVWVFPGYGKVPAITSILGGLLIFVAIVARTLMAGAPFVKGKFNN